MTIQDLIDKLQEISLNHKDIKSFHVGNTWNMSASKSSDIYPNVWVEFPFLINYNKNVKIYSFSFDVLMLPKQDDTNDVMEKISKCEVIADNLLYAFQTKIKNFTVTKMNGLSVKNINADIACGVRIDVDFNTNRECDPLTNFNQNMDRN